LVANLVLDKIPV